MIPGYVIDIGGKTYGYDDQVDARVASRIIGVSESTIRKYATNRILPIYKINNRTIRFLVKDLIEWIEDKRIEPS